MRENKKIECDLQGILMRRGTFLRIQNMYVVKYQYGINTVTFCIHPPTFP